MLYVLNLKDINSFQMEFLPDYFPSEEEVLDPNLYAENVRTLMVRRLGLPRANLSYEDARGRAKSLT